MTDKQAATAAELRDAFVARHFQADTSCCSDGEPVSGKLVHIGMFGDFPCRAGREREREASNTADLDALLSAARAEAIAEHGAAAFQAARSEAWDQAAERRANEIAAARAEALNEVAAIVAAKIPRPRGALTASAIRLLGEALADIRALVKP